MDHFGQPAVSPGGAPPVPADPGATLFVWGAWAVMLAGVLIFIRTYAVNLPFGDEWEMVSALTHHQPVTLKYLWSLHNEHRIALPRLVYLGLAKLTHNDFRAGMYFTGLGLGAVAAAMILAARRLRGWTSYADTFFPLALLHVGHCENLLWSFQVQFMSSTFLACGLLFLILHSRQTLTWRTGLAGGLCLVGLTLCGANGLPFVIPLAGWLAYWAWSRRQAGAAGFGNLALVLMLTAAALGLVKLYFTGLQRTAPPSPGWRATAAVAGEVLAVSLGAGVSPWWPYVGYALGGLLLVTVGVLLVRGWRQPLERVRCVGLLLFLVAVAGLALGIGWGRASYGPAQGFWYRYTMLAVPLLCVVFFLGEVAGSARLGRFLQMALFTCLGVLLVPNTQVGLFYAKYKYDMVKPLERDLQPALTSHQFAQKHSFVYPDLPMLESCLEMLRTAGVGKFARLSPPTPPEVSNAAR